MAIQDDQTLSNDTDWLACKATLFGFTQMELIFRVVSKTWMKSLAPQATDWLGVMPVHLFIPNMIIFNLLVEFLNCIGERKPPYIENVPQQIRGRDAFTHAHYKWWMTEAIENIHSYIFEVLSLEFINFNICLVLPVLHTYACNDLFRTVCQSWRSQSNFWRSLSKFQVIFQPTRWKSSEV